MSLTRPDESVQYSGRLEAQNKGETKVLETTTCSRCGGSGQYSYCQMYGSTCFKCGGRKIVYTKRGAAAAIYLENLRSKPASELKVGDVIAVDAGLSTKRHWAAVEAIEPTNTNGWSSMVNGVMTPVTGDFLTIKTAKVELGGVKADKMVRMAQTAEQKTATLAAAVAYQETLTKSGTPKKTGKRIAA